MPKTSVYLSDEDAAALSLPLFLSKDTVGGRRLVAQAQADMHTGVTGTRPSPV